MHPAHRFVCSAIAVVSLFMVQSASAAEQVTVAIDAGKVCKVNPRGFASANLCWLTDSDRHHDRPVSMADALGDMGVGALRFPYGHLGDYYLWHDGPYEDLETRGLNHRMVGMPWSMRSWSWAVEPDGTLTTAMDFDEYIALCKKLKAKPVVVVNTMSMYTDDTMSRERLIQSAAEWVRYAKKKDYPVAYWSIGNEVDHKPSQRHRTREAYFELYTEMVKAMKAIDPTIRTGPGILGNRGYYDHALSLDPGLVDFLCVHQYMFFYRSDNADKAWQENPLKAWQNTASTEGYKMIATAERALRASGRDKIELLVTETGITGSPKTAGQDNNLWKSLWWLEVLMHQTQASDVSYSFFWGTHSPWDGPAEADIEGKDQGVLLRMDNNARKPTGEVVRIFNRYFYRELLDVQRVHGQVRVFASRDPASGRLSIFLLNKGDISLPVRLNFTGSKAIRWSHLCYAGRDARDPQPALAHVGDREPADSFKVTCPGMSLTILHQ